MSKVSVVIPTYNGLNLLKKHLPAVIDSLRDADEVIIVDDCSTDLSFGYLKEKYQLKQDQNTHFFTGYISPDEKIALTIVSTPKNMRFAGAVNLGVQVATGDYIFLLNNDVSPKKDVLEHLLPHFDDSKCFAVGCKEYEQDETGEVSGKNILWFDRGRFMHARAPKMTTGETAWVSGGSGLYDREKWLLLSGFDNRFYPAYWEDIDLSFRARKRGWQVLFEEKAIVFHKHESTHQNVFGAKKIRTISLKNGAAFTAKHASLSQYLQYLLWKPYWFIKLHSL